MFLEPAQQRAEGGEENQTGYDVVLWAGSRKGNSPARPAWEWVSISDKRKPPPSFPLPPSHPSLLSPLLCSQQLSFSPSFCPPLFHTFSPFPSSRPSFYRGGVKKSFLMGFSQIVFTDISEIFRRKENIWTYFSLIGSLMAMCCVPVLSTQTDAW